MKKVIVSVCASMLVLSLMIGCPAPAPTVPEAKTLKVGCLGAMTGPAAPWGWNLMHGLELKVDEINAAGGLKVGADIYKIEIINYDHKARADEATTVTKKMVYDDKVNVIIGNVVGATCDAAQLITEPNKVLFFFCCWGIKNLGPDKPYSFRELLGPLEVGPPFYDWLHKKFPEVKTVAVIDPNDTSGWDSFAGSKLGAEKAGMSVVAEVYYERGTKEFGPFVTKLLAAKPDMIDYSGSPPGDAALVAKILMERGYKGVMVYEAGLNPKPFMEVAGAAADETYNPLSWDLEGELVTAELRDLAARHEAKYGEPLELIAAVNYAGAEVVFKAMQIAGSVDDTDKIIEAIEGRKFDTVMGPLVLGGEATYGINRQFLHPMVVSVFRGGKIIDLETILPFELR